MRQFSPSIVLSLNQQYAIVDIVIASSDSMFFCFINAFLCDPISVQQAESGYGSEHSLRRHGSRLSLTSTASLSTASASSFKVFVVAADS